MTKICPGSAQWCVRGTGGQDHCTAETTTRAGRNAMYIGIGTLILLIILAIIIF